MHQPSHPPPSILDPLRPIVRRLSSRSHCVPIRPIHRISPIIPIDLTGPSSARNAQNYETNPNANRQTPMKSTFPREPRQPQPKNEPKSPRSRISKAFAACPNFLCVSTISFFHLLPSIFHPLSLLRQPRRALLRPRISACQLLSLLSTMPVKHGRTQKSTCFIFFRSASPPLRPPSDQIQPNKG